MALERKYDHTKEEIRLMELHEDAEETVASMTVPELVQFLEDRNIDPEAYDDELDMRDTVTDKLYHESIRYFEMEEADDY